MSTFEDFRALPAPLRATAEITLNRYIGADTRALDRAGALSGASLVVCFTDLGLAVTFIGERHGLQVAGLPEDTPDVCLTGRSTHFARIFFSGGRGGLLGAGLRIEGDIGVAQQFADLFSSVDFDLGDLLDGYFGPVLGGVMERGAREARQLLSRLRHELPEQLVEYLQEETRDLVGRREYGQWAGEVDDFRDQAERLGARVKRIERRRP